MAFESNIVTFIGNLTEDPEVKYTQGGHAVCTIRLANNRKYTAGGQEREETTYINVVTWRDLAENIGQSFRKGDRAIAIGKLKVRSYENKDGQTVWVTEIEADEIGPSLRWATARPQRANSNGGGGQRRNNGGGNGQRSANGQGNNGPSAAQVADQFTPTGGNDFAVDEGAPESTESFF